MSTKEQEIINKIYRRREKLIDVLIKLTGIISTECPHMSAAVDEILHKALQDIDEEGDSNE